MQCCADVRATYRKQRTPQLWMWWTGEWWGFFCSLKFPYLSTMSQQFLSPIVVKTKGSAWARLSYTVWCASSRLRIRLQSGLCAGLLKNRVSRKLEKGAKLFAIHFWLLEPPPRARAETYLWRNWYALSPYISRQNGDHYYIQTRHNDLFSHCNLVLAKF